MSEARITIIDVARAAGVSKMTVSRALRGERGIAPATRTRILALAGRLGYRQDPAITALMGHLRKSKFSNLEPLAWMTTYDSIGGWRSNPGTCEMYRGATARAHKLGYRLEEFSLCTPGMTPQRLSKILYNQSIRGIVLAPLLQHGSIKGFSWEHFATVCCGPSLRAPKLHRISVDPFAVHRTAWNSLSARGYERIGLCVSVNDNARVGCRWQGSDLVTNQSLPKSRRIPPMLTDNWKPETFLRWYERHRPDVVLSLPDVYDWMKNAGIRIPEDCGFASLRLDQLDNAAGVDHRFVEIGAAAVALAASELHTNQYGIPRVRKSVAIESRWRPGPTIREPSTAASRQTAME